MPGSSPVAAARKRPLEADYVWSVPGGTRVRELAPSTRLIRASRSSSLLPGCHLELVVEAERLGNSRARMRAMAVSLSLFTRPVRVTLPFLTMMWMA